MSAKKTVWTVALAAALLTLAGCSSPEDRVARFYERGASFMAEGDWVKARIEFQNVLQINPDMVPALVGLAEIAERNAEWERVFALLNRAIEVDPTHLPAHVRLGKLLLAADELDRALAASDAAFALDPANAEVLALRAAVMFKLNDIPAALALANQALQADPQQTDALVVLASERLQADDPAGAITFLDRGLSGDEGNVALQLIKVQALERTANSAEAERIFRRLIEIYPENRSFRQILSQFYVMNNQLEQARAEFLATVAAFPTDAEAKFDVVRFMNTTQSPEAGMAQLEQFIAASPNDHELRFFQAAMHNAAGNRDAAQAAHREIVARAGDAEAGTRARAVLAGEALAANDRATGRTLIDEILTRDARNEAGLLLRAGIAIDEQRLDDAVADLRTVLRDSPNSARAHTMLGRAHELQGANDLALDHYGRGHQAGRQQGPQFGMALAEFMLRTDRDRQVEAVLRDVLTNNPGHVPAMRLLAQAYINTGDLASAQFVADELAKIEGQAVAASQVQGAVFVARQNFDSAIGALRRAHDFAPSELQPMVTLVRGYMAAGRQRDALNFMQSVVNASPNNVDARLLQAQLKQQTGDNAGARQAYEAVLAINPRVVPAYMGLMNMAVADGRMADADSWLDKGLQATDNDFNLRLARASVLENLSRYEEAIALYETLLRDRPGMEVVINNLASLLTDYRTDRPSHDRAYQLAQRFRNSQVPQFRDTLGWASFKVGRVEDAVLLLRSAVDALPDVAVVHYHYGMVQLAQNNRVIARDALQRAVALGESQPFSQLDKAREALASL